jgi:hypothetical protein
LEPGHIFVVVLAVEEEGTLASVIRPNLEKYNKIRAYRTSWIHGL